jgi:hypothetical protein
MTCEERTAGQDLGGRSVGELRRDQQRESAGLGLGTQGQRHGALMGALIGAVLGGLVVGLLGVIAFSEPSSAVILAAIGAAFGAVASAVYWGGRSPELAGELRAADGRPDESAAVASNPPSANEHGDIRARRR